MYQLLCTAAVIEGIQASPFVAWVNSTGDVIRSEGDIRVGSPEVLDNAILVSLEFRILRTEHIGNYTCQAALYSVALNAPLIATETSTVVVQSKLIVCSTFRLMNMLDSIINKNLYKAG